MPTIAIIDIETNGLNPDTDEIIEIAIILARNLSIIEIYHAKILPTDMNATEFGEAAKVNRCNATSWKDAIPLQEMIDSVERIIKEADAICGYNVAFDIAFLKRHIEIFKSERSQVIDLAPVYATRELILGNQYPSLRKSCGIISGIDVEFHNALDDALAAYMLLQHMIKNI